MKKKLTALLITLIILVYGLSVLAFSFDNPLGDKTVEEVINAIVDFFFWVTIVAAPLMIIVAGYFIVVAQDDVKKLERAKNIIWYAVIGLVIVFLAKGLVAVLKYILS